MRNPKPKGDYEVGYGKPPKNTRFKPGISGNRSGRPKGSKNARTVAEQVFLKRKIPLVENGKSRNVSVLEGMLLRVAERALNKGDPRALLAALSVMQRTGLLTEQEAQAIQDSLSPEDQALLDQFFKDKGLRDGKRGKQEESDAPPGPNDVKH